MREAGKGRGGARPGTYAFRQRRFLNGSWFLAVSGGIGEAAGGAYRQLPEHSQQAESRRRIPTGFYQLNTQDSLLLAGLEDTIPLGLR
jgi:hypothetical protein